MKRSLVILLTAFAAFATFATVAPAQTMGKLKTSVNPSRAGIFVDGKYIGPAGNFGFARTYSVAAGEHDILITEPRYQDVTRKVTITAGQTFKLSERLTPVAAPMPPFGLLRVKHPDKFAAVFLNNKYYGHVDEFSNFAQGVKLNPGEYEIKISPTTGAAEHVEKFTIAVDKTTTIEVK